MTIRRELSRTADAPALRRIRRLWQQHSIAEDRRDIDGLVATLAPGCVYEILGTDLTWTGHDGARAFYTELFEAFPDNQFELTDIVIGPQGVFEAARLRATFVAPFAGLAGSGRPVELAIAIHFPWDLAAQRFGGERILVDRTALMRDPAGQR